jgi:hypothetical protein
MKEVIEYKKGKVYQGDKTARAKSKDIWDVQTPERAIERSPVVPGKIDW